MLGTIKAGLELVKEVFGWTTSEAGYKEWSKARKLAKHKDYAQKALDNNDWEALREAVGNLERESTQP